jgi:transposase-like protein
MPIISVPIPLCPKCGSNAVERLGSDAAAKRKNKINYGYKCIDCSNTFSDHTVEQANRLKKMQD